MATTITVPGANGTTVSLSYDTQSNAALAQRIADAIRNGVDNNTILPVDNKFGPPPPLPTGATGEFIQSIQGVTLLPQGYKDVVNTAKTGAIYGSGDANEGVLSGGQGNLTFFATGGSGTVAAGGGNNFVSIPTTDTGAWLIATGNGNDTIRALGPGNDTISAGGGNNVIQVGAGNTFIGSAGADTILAATGSETITAVDAAASDVVYGNASNVFFVGGGGSTVFGGTGSDTVFGGTGPDLLFGGSKVTTSCRPARAQPHCSAAATAISSTPAAAVPRSCMPALATKHCSVVSARAATRSMVAPAPTRSLAAAAATTLSLVAPAPPPLPPAPAPAICSSS
jgi:Ca2+-binding RTX toxin-like protein